MTLVQFDKTHYVTRIEDFLEDYIAKQNIADTRLRDAICYSLFGAGKRVRPLLVYATGEIFGISLEVLDVLAAALEMVHCYSLIHDDLPCMDNDDLRRGKPSCHKAFDEATAILAGNALQVLALELLSCLSSYNLTADKIQQINKIFFDAIGPAGLLSGQSLDMTELNNTSLDIEALYAIHHLKTGKLIAAPITMVMALDSLDVCSELVNLSSQLGILFQIQDDFLDQYADSVFTGKKTASDTSNCKYTFAHKFSRTELQAMLDMRYSEAYVLLDKINNSHGLQSIILDLEQRYKKYACKQEKMVVI